MYKLVSIGNVSVDIFFKGDCLTHKDGRFQLAVGGKYFVDSTAQKIGGGGANVAIGASRHGLYSAVLCRIGNTPSKKIILDKLAEEGVNIDLCQYVDDYVNTSAILLTEHGERTIIHYTSPQDHIFVNKSDYAKLLSAEMVFLGNMAAIDFKERMDLIRYLDKNGVYTIVNFGVKDCRRPKEELDEFLKYTEMLIVNAHEFSDMVKTPIEEIKFNKNIVTEHLPYLKDKVVIITDGDKGCYAYYRGMVLTQAPTPVATVVDTTGAGDAFTAGFLAGYHNSGNIQYGMKLGVDYAAKILQKIGAN